MLTLPLPLVKMTTTTTGTGDYTLVEAAGYRSLADFLTAGTTEAAYVCCTIYMGDNYETGMYRLSASTTLVRVSITRSSNANAAVNWAAGEKTIVVGPLIQGALFGKHDFNSTPPSNEGVGAGWAQGSVRMSYTTRGSTQDGRLWICRDGETPVGVGRWVGVITANGGGVADGKLLDYSTLVPQRGSHALGPSADYAHPTIVVEDCVGLGFGGLAEWNNMVLKGAGWGTDVGEYEDIISVSLSAETTDATPTKLTNKTDSGNNERTYLSVPFNCVLRVKGTVTSLATVATGGDCSTWDVEFTVKRGAAGDPALVGTADVTMKKQDAGAAAWAVAVGIDTTNDGFYIEVTLEAATTIRTLANLRVAKVAYA